MRQRPWSGPWSGLPGRLPTDPPKKTVRGRWPMPGSFPPWSGMIPHPSGIQTSGTCFWAFTGCWKNSSPWSTDIWRRRRQEEISCITGREEAPKSPSFLWGIRMWCPLRETGTEILFPGILKTAPCGAEGRWIRSVLSWPLCRRRKSCSPRGLCRPGTSIFPPPAPRNGAARAARPLWRS